MSDGSDLLAPPAKAEGYRPKYRWRETWPGEGHQDYAAWDGGLSFGRVQLDLVTPTKKGQWMWNTTFIAWAKVRVMPHGGWATTAREASRMVEENYEAIKLGNGRGG